MPNQPAVAAAPGPVRDGATTVAAQAPTGQIGVAAVGDAVHLRSSDQPDAPGLTVPRGHWDVFVARIKGGELDLPLGAGAQAPAVDTAADLVACARLADGTNVQTPIWRYVHPDSGRRITVIGALHVGESAYYAGLRATVDQLVEAGAVVQVEGGRLLPDGDTNLSDEEQQILAAFDRCAELEKQRIPLVGLVHQIDGLGYPPEWKVVDLSQLQITRRVGSHLMGKLVQAMLADLDWPLDDPAAAARMQAIAVAAYQNALAPNHAARTPANPIAAVVIHQRTQLALDGALAVNGDVVLIWGCGHVPGLHTGLTSAGFVPDGDPEWRTAAHLPGITGGQQLAPAETL